MNIGLIFGMVIAMLVIGFVLTFGLDQLTRISDINEDVQAKKTLDSLETAVERVYSLGGESAESFRLTFPQSVKQICFFPLYRMRYGEREEYTLNDLKNDLWRVLSEAGYSRTELSQLRTVLAAQRMQVVDGETLDRKHNMLFITGNAAPQWHYVKYLAPEKKAITGSGSPQVLCTKPMEEVWLQRKYDSQGAWVDVELKT